MSVINKFLALTFGVSTPDSKIIECRESIKELEAERDALKQQNSELAAQVEMFRKALEYADNKLYILTHNRDDVSARLVGDADKAFKVVRDTLSQSSTPAQCLLEVKAGAIDDFANEVCGNCASWFQAQLSRVAEKYANKVRGGE